MEWIKGGSCIKPGWAEAALFIPVALLTSRGVSSKQKQTAMAHATATTAGPGLWALADSCLVTVSGGLCCCTPLWDFAPARLAALKTEGKT